MDQSNYYKDGRPRPTFNKSCAICGTSFVTLYRSKEICSFECKEQRARDNARDWHRLAMIEGTKKKETPPCEVCDFPVSEIHHEGLGRTYRLCPNHHSAITRGRATLEQVLAGWPD